MKELVLERKRNKMVKKLLHSGIEFCFFSQNMKNMDTQPENQEAKEGRPRLALDLCPVNRDCYSMKRPPTLLVVYKARFHEVSDVVRSGRESALWGRRGERESENKVIKYSEKDDIV